MELMKLIVMIPAYNEEESISSVVKEIPRIIDGINSVEILIIDDGSVDSTVDEAKKAGTDHILKHISNQGLAKTFRDGLNKALELGADIIVNTDADFQYNGQEIPQLIKPILQGKADIVIGNRQISTLDHMPVGKLWGNRIATKVTRFATGLPILDAQTGFRAFSRDAALKMNLTGDYTYVQETLIQAAHKDLTLIQIPVEFRKREGESRLISSLPRYARMAGMTILRSFRDYNPFMVFFSVGLILIIIGLVSGTKVIIHYLATGGVTPYLPSAVLTTVLVTVGLQAIVFGLLADMMKTQREFMEEILYRIKK